MHRLLLGLLVCSVSLTSCSAGEQSETGEIVESEPIQVEKTDWPWWRGYDRTGIADPNQNPPLEWSETENVLWKTPVPGRGHGTPILVNGRLYLATAEKEPEELQSVHCFDAKTGKELWKTVAHKGGQTTAGNKKSSQASGSLACDGSKLYINFLNNDAVTTTALDMKGDIVWQTKISNYVVHQGYGSSPCLYGPLVIVSADNKGGGAVAALNRADGSIVWKHSRPDTPNYASPVIHHIDGKDQLLFSGCDLVVSYDPLSGDKLWEREGSTTECVTTIVTDGTNVFTSGGYPRNHVSAIKADGSAEVSWENNTRVYVPSMIVKDGYLYAVTDGGVAMCWESATGEEVWKGRLGGTFSSSPVMVGDKIYATNESGETFVFKATSEKFELLGKNKLGDDVFATPVIVNSRIYLRVAHQQNDKRQEMLYCIGQGE